MGVSVCVGKGPPEYVLAKGRDWILYLGRIPPSPNPGLQHDFTLSIEVHAASSRWLSDSLTIPHIYDWHYEHNLDHPAFVYGNDQGIVTNLVYSELVPAMHRAGQYIATSIGINVQADQNTYPTMAFLSTAGIVVGS